MSVYRCLRIDYRKFFNRFRSDDIQIEESKCQIIKAQNLFFLSNNNKNQNFFFVLIDKNFFYNKIKEFLNFFNTKKVISYVGKKISKIKKNIFNFPR